MLPELKRRVALAPQDPEARFALGEALFLEGAHDAAIAQLERAVALEPDHANARRLLGRAYLRAGRPVPAERIFTETVRQSPNDAAAREDLADVLLAIGRVDDALLHLEAAISARGDDVGLRKRAAELARRRHLLGRATKHLEAARGLAPEDATIAKELAEIRLEQGDALGVMVSPLERGRDYLLGRTREAMLQGALAAELKRGVLKEVAAKVRIGDVEGAKRALVLAPAAEHKTLAFAWLRAELMLLSGDRVKARELFSRACESHPSALCYRRLAELDAASHGSAQAIAPLRRAIEVAPDEAEAHDALGDALAQLGHDDEARRAWERSLELCSDPIVAAKLSLRGRRLHVPPPHGRIAGLAWNKVGGHVIGIEASAVPGRGELVVTGNLGSDIAESARVVHALLKARAAAFGITDAIEKDLHIHVVDTEVTTDGRSAGIAIALASLSALEQRPLCEGLAASGEITLHGAIRPVAGIHEKLVAAYLHGITKVLMPRKNLFDVRGLASDATSRLELHFVDTLEEALEHAFFRQARKNPAANLV